MNELLLYLLIGVGGLLVLLILPPTRPLAELALKAIVDALKVVLEHKMTFLIWLIKTISSDHVRVLEHMFKRQNDIDPTLKVRRRNR